MVAQEVSQAPEPKDRARGMKALRDAGEELFVTVEPILRGDPTTLARWICDLRPSFVNVGADSKGTGLDEPTADEVRTLLRLLAESGVEVREKTNLGRLLK